MSDAPLGPGRRVPALWWAVAAAAAVWLVYLLWALSDAGVARAAEWIAGIGGALLVVAFVALSDAAPDGDSSEPYRPRWPLFLVLASCVVVAVLFLVARPPHNPLFRARFHASREALGEQADGVLVFAPPDGERRVGLFRVRTELSERQVRFWTGDCGRGRRCGIVYAPGARPRGATGETLTSLGGPWYHVGAATPRP